MKSFATPLSIAALSVLSLFTGAAHAVDGSVTINGEVTAQTCQISGDGQGAEFIVTLPTVSSAQLNAAGVTAGRTPFKIELTQCDPASGKVGVYFEPGLNVNTATGRLINKATTNGAQNVEIGLLNDDTSVINLGSAVQATQNMKTVAIAADGSATLNYFAEYAATAAASAGTVTTQSLYSVVYQ
ncbi:MAG: fimbrial protein [Ottowia sp.]|uniref:fimbrial protein n=1 Tax=Ottowia sp. TaxID=1898956 RepID=UPI003C74C2A3